jgi:hypothetical protein
MSLRTAVLSTGILQVAAFGGSTASGGDAPCIGSQTNSALLFQVTEGELSCNDVVAGNMPASEANIDFELVDGAELRRQFEQQVYCGEVDGTPTTAMFGTVQFKVQDLCPETCGACAVLPTGDRNGDAAAIFGYPCGDQIGCNSLMLGYLCPQTCGAFSDCNYQAPTCLEDCPEYVETGDYATLEECALDCPNWTWNEETKSCPGDDTGSSCYTSLQDMGSSRAC